MMLLDSFFVRCALCPSQNFCTQVTLLSRELLKTAKNCKDQTQQNCTSDVPEITKTFHRRLRKPLRFNSLGSNQSSRDRRFHLTVAYKIELRFALTGAVKAVAYGIDALPDCLMSRLYEQIGFAPRALAQGSLQCGSRFGHACPTSF